MNPLPNYAKVVFENAIEIDDSEDRSAYIDQQCANDRSLRRKVAGLLHAHDCAGSFLEMTAIDSDDLSLALERVATAEGRIADGHNALPQLAGNVQRLRTEIEQCRQQQQHFQRFQRMARDAQDAMLYDKDKELQEDQLALQALALYGVLQDDRWIDRLKESYLSKQQQSQVRRTAYETLLVLADIRIRKSRRKERVAASFLYL